MFKNCQKRLGADPREEREPGLVWEGAGGRHSEFRAVVGPVPPGPRDVLLFTQWPLQPVSSWRRHGDALLVAAGLFLVHPVYHHQAKFPEFCFLSGDSDDDKFPATSCFLYIKYI